MRLTLALDVFGLELSLGGLEYISVKAAWMSSVWISFNFLMSGEEKGEIDNGDM